jgi:hypothetical protein
LDPEAVCKLDIIKGLLDKEHAEQTCKTRLIGVRIDQCQHHNCPKHGPRIRVDRYETEFHRGVQNSPKGEPWYVAKIVAGKGDTVWRNATQTIRRNGGHAFSYVRKTGLMMLVSDRPSGLEGEQKVSRQEATLAFGEFTLGAGSEPREKRPYSCSTNWRELSQGAQKEVEEQAEDNEPQRVVVYDWELRPRDEWGKRLKAIPVDQETLTTEDGRRAIPHQSRNGRGLFSVDLGGGPVPYVLRMEDGQQVFARRRTRFESLPTSSEDSLEVVRDGMRNDGMRTKMYDGFLGLPGVFPRCKRSLEITEPPSEFPDELRPQQTPEDALEKGRQLWAKHALDGDTRLYDDDETQDLADQDFGE